MSFVRPVRPLLVASLLLPLLGTAAFAAANNNTPPPATNLAPTMTPSPVNEAPPPPSGFLFDTGAPLADLGKTLANNGVYLKGFYSGVLYGVPSGGLQHTDVFYNEVFYGADFDLEKIIGLPGAVIHFSLDSRFGGFPQGVGNLTGFSEGFLAGTGPDNNTRLNEFSLDEHLWDDKIRFVVGRTTLASYFGTSELYCQFISSICSNMVPFNWSSNSNDPFWPISTWAGEVAFWPTKNAYLRVGAEEANSSQFTHAGFPWNGGWGIKNATGVFTPIEAGYVTRPSETRYPTRIDVGFYHDSSDFTDFRYNTAGAKLALAGGTPGTNSGSSVVYAQARQTIWRPDPKSSVGSIDAFAGILQDAGGHAFVQTYFEAGLVAHGPIPFRPNDSAGVVFTNFLFNHRATGYVDDELAAGGHPGNNVSNQSQLVEVNYGIAVAPGVSIKPFMDFTFHPDQDIFDVIPKPGVNYALAAGGQLFILFGPALGLPGLFREY
jgi:porin